MADHIPAIPSSQFIIECQPMKGKQIKQWKRMCLLIPAVLLLCTLFAGCSTRDNDDQTTLTFVSDTNTHGISLDPAIDYCGSRNVSIGTCETLFKLNNDTLDVEAHLAGYYTRADDHTWQINIRDDIVFSNGKKLTAAAVKKALAYDFNGIVRLSTMLDIDSMQADGQVLTIKTKSVVATLPRILTDPGALIFDTEGTTDYSKGVIGTGPYILESMDEEGNCKLIRNETYWQGVPGADKVHTKFISEASAITIALQAGELDFAKIEPSDISLFESSDEYEVMGYETGRVYFLYLNPEYAATKDPALRKALTYAFDRQAYLDAIYDGRGKTTTTIFPVWSGFSVNDVSQVKYNPDKARQILADAGYRDGDGDGILEKNGETISLTIACYANNGFSVLSEVLQASLLKLGINSHIMVSDAIVADLKKGHFNVATYGYTTLTMGDCFNFLEPVFRTGAFANFAHFSSTTVDSLLTKLKATSDVAARKQLAIEIQKNIYAEDDHVFLIHISTYNVVRKGVKNVTPDLGNSFNLWKITKE